LREDHRLRVFENTVLRKIFGPKRDEVIWDWRRLYKEELYDLYSPNIIIRVIKSKLRWGGERCIQGYGVEARGKRPRRRPRRR
jgi:hypothetical protein